MEIFYTKLKTKRKAKKARLQTDQEFKEKMIYDLSI